MLNLRGGGTRQKGKEGEGVLYPCLIVISSSALMVEGSLFTLLPLLTSLFNCFLQDKNPKHEKQSHLEVASLEANSHTPVYFATSEISLRNSMLKRTRSRTTTHEEP